MANINSLITLSFSLFLTTNYYSFPLEPCVKLFQRLADEIGLQFRIFAPETPKKPIIVLTWDGTQPELPAIMLNSHTDVVPVFEVSHRHH